MNIYVLTWEHKYGQNVWAFASLERAQEQRRKIAEEWFDVECSHMEKPEDRDELADLYFEETQEYESCWIRECDLEG